MEWLKRLIRAVDYIEDHLADDISYDEAAKIAFCSTCYFQRMFSCIAGVSVSEYIRRRRMTVAALELQTTDIKVIDLGLKYGYSSPTAFNRAFQSVHRVPPHAARIQGTPLKAYPRLRFSPAVTGEGCWRYRVEEKEALRLVGVRTQIVQDMEACFNLVPRFWDATLEGPDFAEICRLNNRPPFGVLGGCICQDPDHLFYYIAAASEGRIPDGMFEYEIPAATRVVFECDGPYPEAIQNAYRHFFTEWLPFSGYECLEQPDIEVYPVSRHKLKTGQSQVWIAIQNKN